MREEKDWARGEGRGDRIVKDEEVRKTDMARNGGHTMLAKRDIGVTA